MLKFKLLVSTLASDDIDNVLAWYQEQQPGLEKEFVVELREFYRRILYNPERYGFYVLSKQIRKARLKKFPYSILSQINDDIIYIAGIIHKARSDEFIKGRYL